MSNKRLALSFVTLVLAMSVIVRAAATAGNSATGGSTDSHNVPATAAISTVGASSLVSGLGAYQGALTQAVMTDSPGGGSANTWTPHTAQNSTNARIQISHVTNPTVNASHTFATLTGSSAFPALSEQTFLGVDTSSPFDGENGANTGGATSLATGNVTPSANGAVLFACLAIGVVDTPTMGGSGWSAPIGTAFNSGHSFGVWCSYKIQTTATAEQATFNWSTSTDAATSIAAFKASGGGGATPCRRSLLGVGCDDLAAGPAIHLAGEHRTNIAAWLRGAGVERQGEQHAGRQQDMGLHKAADYTSTVSVYARGVRK